MAGCGGCGGNARRATFRVPAGDSTSAASDPAAAAAASLTEYEVLDARGNRTNRFFTSLVAASGYAQRIGGTTRPV